jgi:hypothetical protein
LESSEGIPAILIAGHATPVRGPEAHAGGRMSMRKPTAAARLCAAVSAPASRTALYDANGNPT